MSRVRVGVRMTSSAEGSHDFLELSWYSNGIAIDLCVFKINPVLFS